jgi:hypothetical protein
MVPMPVGKGKASAAVTVAGGHGIETLAVSEANPYSRGKSAHNKSHWSDKKWPVDHERW